MKIALIGYGRMGRMVETAALKRGYEISVKTGRDGIDPELIKSADVCIDFTHPSCVVNNIHTLARYGKNMVVGTTGWDNQLDGVREVVDHYQVGLLYAPNFSIGVHLFLKIVADAARLLNIFPGYDVAMLEMHHNKKEDSPSGTAKAIAGAIMKEMHRKNHLAIDAVQGAISSSALQVASVRCGSIPGTHSVIFSSAEDNITLTHEALNRSGFAEGAIVAADWLRGKKGFYTLEDMLGESK